MEEGILVTTAMSVVLVMAKERERTTVAVTVMGRLVTIAMSVVPVMAQERERTTVAVTVMVVIVTVAEVLVVIAIVIAIVSVTDGGKVARTETVPVPERKVFLLCGQLGRTETEEAITMASALEVTGADLVLALNLLRLTRLRLPVRPALDLAHVLVPARKKNGPEAPSNSLLQVSKPPLLLNFYY